MWGGKLLQQGIRVKQVIFLVVVSVSMLIQPK